MEQMQVVAKEPLVFKIASETLQGVIRYNLMDYPERIAHYKRAVAEKHKHADAEAQDLAWAVECYEVLKKCLVDIDVVVVAEGQFKDTRISDLIDLQAFSEGAQEAVTLGGMLIGGRILGKQTET